MQSGCRFESRCCHLNFRYGEEGARSSLTFRQPIECGFTLKLVRDMMITYSQTTFNVRLNNHRKLTKKPNSILACKHFQGQGNNFTIHTKFIIIGSKMVNLHGSKGIIRVARENFWIPKLKTRSIWT